MLRREGQIETWFDREILAGQNIDDEVSKNLEDCQLFLFLASPDSIASNYCYEIEMERALKRHEQNEALVVPIIIEPCDWLSSPLGKLKALPENGKPISDWTNPNNAYLDIVQELRRLLETELSERAHQGTSDQSALNAPPVVAKKYRVKRSFDEIDRAEYRESAFSEMKNYFEHAAKEIGSVDGIRARFKSISESSFGCTIVNQGLNGQSAHITVHMGRDRFGLGDLYYSFEENAAENHANGAFNVYASDYALHLQRGFSGFDGKDGIFTSHEAAETLWAEFLKHAGVTYE